MKYIFILLLLITFAGCKNNAENTEAGQENQNDIDIEEAEIDRPKPLNFNYTYPKNILSKRDGDMDFELYPIGFSPEGHFAYINRPCAGGCGCCRHDMHIQNLLSDKVEVSHNINNEVFDSRDHLKDWKMDFRNIKKMLISKGISQSEMFLETNKVFYDKDGIHKYEIKVGKKESYDPESEYGNKITYSVFVKMDDVKSKRITHGDFTDGVDFEYVGFIRSPFGEQLAVVLNKKTRGFEAEIFSDIVVVGCNLDPKYFR
jgi:hypothetical protein